VPSSRSHAFIPDHQETDMRPSKSTALSLGALALLAACSSGGEAQGEGNASGTDAAAQLELADDPELANQAAAAEALDTELYGGNAAAGETGNTSAARIPTHTPAERPANDAAPKEESPRR
jgi:hypothetical protein